MKISYVQFIVDIPGVGSFWSSDKHGAEWSVEEKGSWLHMTSSKNGHKRRIPITSVACISEAPTEDKPKSKAGV